MKRLNRSIQLGLLITLLLASGCAPIWVAGGAAAVGGASAVVYHRGWYRGVVAYPHFQVDRAILRVANRARFIERERTCDGSSSRYLYQDIRDVRVRFKLKAVTPDSTRVYIRVGSVGDKESSQKLFDAIREELEAGVR